ncbi:hypothetical protein [Streptomyces sp. NPDC055006]
MKTAALKRTFLRTNRHGMVAQILAKQDHGKERNYRSKLCREILASNRAYLRLHPEWR